MMNGEMRMTGKGRERQDNNKRETEVDLRNMDFELCLNQSKNMYAVSASGASSETGM